MMLRAVLYEENLDRPRVRRPPVSQLPRVTWWTKERVLTGLRRFQREQGFTPTSTEAYHKIARSSIKGPGRHYPPAYAVLRYYRTFREGCTAAGLDVDRSHEEYTPEEEWFIREAAGILTREEIAAELRRTPLAVKTWLRWHGLHSYQLHGWNPHRVERVALFPQHAIRKYMDRGELPYFKGTRCIYYDPADLLIVDEIEWVNPPAELELAVRRSLVERLVKILSGQDWTFGRPYKAYPIRTTDKRWRPAMFKSPPRPGGCPSVGDQVRCARSLDDHRDMLGREGEVLLVYYRRNTNRTRPDTKPQWMVRVKFDKTKRRGEKSYVVYSLPVWATEVIGSVGR